MKRILILASMVLALGSLATAGPGGYHGHDKGPGTRGQGQTKGQSHSKGQSQTRGQKSQQNQHGRQDHKADPPQHKQDNRKADPRGKQQTEKRPQHEQGKRGPGSPPSQRHSTQPHGRSQSRTIAPPHTGRSDSGNHNRTDSRSSGAGRIAAPPRVIHNKVINNVHNTTVYRSGYTAYDRTWRDSNFWYPHYVYTYTERCAPSPWYWYPQLPAYLSISVIRPTVSVIFSFGIGNVYAYRPHYYSRFEPDRLDIVADRLQLSFEDGDFDRMSYMVDPNDWVQIQVGDQNDYDVRGQDFRGLMRDMTHDTRTVRYDITRVRSGDGLAAIEARHVYIDPWGREEVVHHRYGLRRTPRGYVIISFRTDLA